MPCIYCDLNPIAGSFSTRLRSSLLSLALAHLPACTLFFFVAASFFLYCILYLLILDDCDLLRFCISWGFRLLSFSDLLYAFQLFSVASATNFAQYHSLFKVFKSFSIACESTVISQFHSFDLDHIIDVSCFDGRPVLVICVTAQQPWVIVDIYRLLSQVVLPSVLISEVDRVWGLWYLTISRYYFACIYYLV